MLVREYIHHALYARTTGYFNALPVIAPALPVAISSLVGRAAWHQHVAQLYASSPHGWATPTELFAPHHARVITRYMLLNLAPSAPLVVYEVGGGSGAHAVATLDFLAASAPHVYARTDYTILEVSPRLQSVQAAALAASGHAGVARSLLADAAALPVAVSDDRPCFALALEVLDNLPHDKVAALRRGGGWAEVRIDTAANAETLHELSDEAVIALLPEVEAARAAWASAIAAQGAVSRFASWVLGARAPPVTGPAHAALARGVAVSHAGASALLREFAAAAAYPPRPLPRAPPLPTGAENVAYARYIPTGALRMLRELRRALPAYRLIAADFSALPPAEVPVDGQAAERIVSAYLPAANAPIVAGRRGDGTQAQDFPTYLSAPAGAADILFPTDFVLLGRVAAGLAAKGRPANGLAASPGARGLQRPAVVHAAEFLRQHAAAEDLAATTTRTGFNPMIEDWPNVRFLLT